MFRIPNQPIISQTHWDDDNIEKGLEMDWLGFTC